MNNNKPFISIIVLNFNGKKWLKECFESLEKLNYPKDKYEVIMGDNASADDSVKYVTENFQGLRVLKFSKNYGFCKGNNLCAKEARGEYLIFLNNDTFVEKDWLRELVKGALSDKNIVSCVGKMLIPSLKEGNIVNGAGGIIFPDGCGMDEGFMESDSNIYNKQKFVGYGSGAGVLIQKKFFISTGGFDEYIYYSNEDADLGFRAWTYGYKVLYVPLAIMYHFVSGTSSHGKGRNTPSIEFMGTRNKLYFILKNFDWTNVIKGIMFHMFCSSARIFYALLNRNIYIPIVIIKAYFLILKDFRKVLKKRNIAQKNKKVQDKELHKIGILIGIKEGIQRYYDGLKNITKYRQNMFDTMDTIKIKINKEGEIIFVKDDL